MVWGYTGIYTRCDAIPYPGIKLGSRLSAGSMGAHRVCCGSPDGWCAVFVSAESDCSHPVLLGLGSCLSEPGAAGTGDVRPDLHKQMGGFASILRIEKRNRVRWKRAQRPQLPGASFGVPEQKPREALVLTAQIDRTSPPGLDTKLEYIFGISKIAEKKVHASAFIIT